MGVLVYVFVFTTLRKVKTSKCSIKVFFNVFKMFFKPATFSMCEVRIYECLHFLSPFTFAQPT